MLSQGGRLFSCFILFSFRKFTLWGMKISFKDHWNFQDAEKKEWLLLFLFSVISFLKFFKDLSCLRIYVSLSNLKPSTSCQAICLQTVRNNQHGNVSEMWIVPLYSGFISFQGQCHNFQCFVIVSVKCQKQLFQASRKSSDVRSLLFVS